MNQIRCLKGVVYRTPYEAFAAIKEVEATGPLRFSMFQCDVSRHWHLTQDGGHARDVACNTKRTFWSEARAHRKRKEMVRAGRRTIVEYECWYSDEDNPHFYLGNTPGNTNYHRSGRIFG